MTPGAVASPARAGEYRPSGLTWHVRELHRPRVIVLNVGWLCVLSAATLSIIGVLAIGTTAPEYAAAHIAHACVGIIAAAAVALPHYRLAQRMSYPVTILTLVLLVFVLLPFVPEWIVRPRNGARRWISIGTDFQPSEIAKVAYVCALASYLRYRGGYRTFRGLLLPLALTFIPMGLILVEPDLGTALVFLPTFFAMVIAAGARIRHVVMIMALGLSAAPLMYPMLQDHQKDRIQALVYQLKGDDKYIDGIGYQGHKAMMLVGAGGVLGVGRERADHLVTLNHLPEEHNDMVFAVVCARWGMLGATVTWGLFGVLAAGGIFTAAQCKDPFGRLAAVGLVAVLTSQMVINTGMTIGVLPITGITLPFVSAGGTSLVTAWIMVGLLLNIAMRRNQYLARQPFEFDEEGE